MLFFIKFRHTELKDKPRLKLATMIATPLCYAFVAVYCQLLHSQKLQKVDRETEDNKENDQENQDQNKDVELSIFELATIARAADSFSMDNNLGEGGFGPVCKFSRRH
ncbi:hypothetical protein SCA6_018547 [Theobroma cacao]